MGDPYGGDGYGGGYGGDPYGGGDYGGHDGGATVTPPKEFNSIAEITEFLSEDDHEAAIIGYFDLETNKDDKIIFEEVICMFVLQISLFYQAHRIGQYKYRFGFTTNKEVLSEMKYHGSVLYVYRPVCVLTYLALIFLLTGQVCC